MTTITGARISRLMERLAALEHARFRENRPLSVFDEGADPAEPVVVRRARALALVLRQMPIYIQDDELLVGGRTMYGQRDTRTREKNVHLFREIPKWSTVYYAHYLTEADIARADLPPGPRPFFLAVGEGFATAHAVVGYHRILELGYEGLRAEAACSEERLRTEAPADLDRRLAFLQAARIILAGASDFARRYATLARESAAAAESAGRRAELAAIADRCAWVADHPPRDFPEALQLFLLARVVSMVESYFCMPLGRFDQFMYPFLERDLAAGRLTRAEALEWLECLFIKLNEEVDISSTDDCCRIMVSGQDTKGRDVTNELSYLCLDASVDLRLPTPKVGVRLHQGTPREFYARCMELVRLGIGGLPEIYNDEGIIPTLVANGIPLADARDYCHDGCSEITIGGRSDFYPVWTRFRFLKTLDEMLKEGQDYATFEDLLAAYNERARQLLEAEAEDGNRRDRALAELSPAPFISATLEGCLERGLDKTWGGTIYNETGMLGMELANTANSLAAIKKFVYDERTLTLAELRQILARDYAGSERTRQMLLNRAPKYGNDDEYVDSIAVNIAANYIQIVNGFRNPRGGWYRPGFFDFGNFIVGAREIGATPDGRKAGTSVAGHLMAVPGTDRSGPTANVRSTCKIMQLQPAMGAMLDIRLHPSTLRGAGGLERLGALVGTYMDLGGHALQFNVVDTATLRAAQREPEKYRDLLVRVWGFSAYFVELTSDFQEQIIARTEHAL